MQQDLKIQLLAEASQATKKPQVQLRNNFRGKNSPFSTSGPNINHHDQEENNHSYLKHSNNVGPVRVRTVQRERVCIKPFNRIDTTQIVPNSVDEDLALGPERFLTVDSTRKWMNNSSKAKLSGPNQPAPMNPMQDQEGEVLKRTICGTKNFFTDALRTRIGKDKLQKEGTASVIMSSGAMSQDTFNSNRERENLNRHKSVQPSMRSGVVDGEFLGVSSGKPKISFNEVVKKGITSFSPFKQQHNKHDDHNDQKSRFGPPKVPLNDEDLLTIVQSVKERASNEEPAGASLPIGNYQNLRAKSNMALSLNQKLFMTRDTRALESYEKHIEEWQEQCSHMKEMRTKKMQQKIGINPVSRKINKDQAIRDMTLIERNELLQEKQNQQDLLSIAINPYELTAGVGYFQWTLRNEHATELQAEGDAIDAFVHRPNTKQEQSKTQTPTVRPPKPMTAQDGQNGPRAFKRLNLAMIQNGSNVQHSFVKKAPDHQKQAVSKTKPYQMFSEQRMRTMTPNATTPITAQNSTSYFEKGFKTFKDFKEIHKKLNQYDNQINELKNYEAYEQLSEMYLAGESKIKNEFYAARKISSPQRKLLVLNESIAKQASSTQAMKATYHKIASKIAPERGEDDEQDISNEISVLPEKTVSIDQSQNKGRGRAGGNIKIIVDEYRPEINTDDFEVIAEGKYDRKNLIY